MTAHIHDVGYATATDNGRDADAPSRALSVLAAPSARELRPRSASDIMVTPHTEPTWVLKDVLAVGAVSTLGGYIGAGKSPFAKRLAMSLFRGGSFLGFEVKTPLGFR